MSNISSGDSETMIKSRTGPRLVVQQGADRGRSFAILPAGLIVGRATECDVPLDDAEVSRRHARFTWHGTRLLAEDLGSANGTLVNGRAITGPQPLNERDLIGIGNTVFIIQGLVSRELTATARNMDAVAPAMPSRYPAPAPQAAPQRSWLWLVVLGLALVVLVAILGLGALWYFGQTSISQAPAVTFLTPANGAQTALNVPLIVQATATDPRGVTRLELWADGALVSQQASPTPQGASPLLLNFSYTPTTPGNHVLELRAFNTTNQQSAVGVVTINTLAGSVTPTGPAATATGAPAPTDSPTATEPAIILFTPTSPPPTFTPVPTAAPQPGLQAVADVNVRGGPGTIYPVLGLLRAGDTALVTGRSADNAWWQIVYPPNSGNTGWVVNTYVQANGEAGGVPVVAGPPPPPTNTPVPATPTSTPLPSAEISFTADSTQLNQGQCTRLRWRVRNVAAYFVDGVAGAGDEGDREVCDPVGSTTHILRVQRLDGSTQEFTVTINVQATGMPRPNLISPDDDENFDEGDDVEFVWSSVSAPGTITYNIEIQSEDDGEWENWRTVTGMNGTSYDMDDFAGARPGRWRVWATSSTLGNSEKTGWREFEFDD